MTLRLVGWRAVTAIVCLFAMGCSSLREIPRSEYATAPEKGRVEVVTNAGPRYEFERGRVSADTLYGTRRLDVEGRFEQFETVPVPLDDVRRMSVRRLDWYRTGLIAGVGAAVILAIVLTQVGDSDSGSSNGECGPRPCP